jgi:pyruvate formate lyase activating enzyme
VDFPGELAAVVFCQGCPWRCAYCHNGHLVPARSDQGIAWNQVKALLDRRRGLLDAVVFSGGEPTLQASLRSAMEGIKAMGFRIGLHTAGPYPERLRPLLPSLDWVGLDIKALPEDYADVTRVPGSGERAWESLGLLIEAGVELEVRTTLVPGWDTVAHIRDLIVALSHAGVENYVVQECRTATMLDPSIASANVTGDLPAEIREMGAARFLRFAVRQARP